MNIGVLKSLHVNRDPSAISSEIEISESYGNGRVVTIALHVPLVCLRCVVTSPGMAGVDFWQWDAQGSRTPHSQGSFFNGSSNMTGSGMTGTGSLAGMSWNDLVNQLMNLQVLEKWLYVIEITYNRNSF